MKNLLKKISGQKSTFNNFFSYSPTVNNRWLSNHSTFYRFYSMVTPNKHLKLKEFEQTLLNKIEFLLSQSKMPARRINYFQLDLLSIRETAQMQAAGHTSEQIAQINQHLKIFQNLSFDKNLSATIRLLTRTEALEIITDKMNENHSSPQPTI